MFPAVQPKHLVKLLIAFGLLVGLVTNVFGQGNFSPVSESNVQALKLNHYFTADKKAHDADFEWTFGKTQFVIKKGKSPIPTDLIEQLLPKAATADEIRGTWKLASEGSQKLVLIDIQFGDKASEKPGNQEARLVIYKTAPRVVRIGELQYVFGIEG